MRYQTQNQPQTIAAYFKAATILFGAFILGIINLGILVLVLFILDVLPLVAFNQELTIYLVLGSIALLAIMAFTGDAVFKKLVSKAKKDMSFAKKLAAYRQGKLIQVVTLEASALVALVFLMLTLHIALVVVAALSLIQMIRIFPKKTELIEILDLSFTDQQRLNNPDYVIEQL